MRLLGGGAVRPAPASWRSSTSTRLPGLPLGLGLADAQHHQQARRQPGRGLGTDQGVGLAQPMPALGMADEHGRRPRLLEHRRAEIEPVNAPLGSAWQSWPPTTMPLPSSWAATSASTVNGGNTPRVPVRRARMRGDGSRRERAPRARSPCIFQLPNTIGRGQGMPISAGYSDARPVNTQRVRLSSAPAEVADRPVQPICSRHAHASRRSRCRRRTTTALIPCSNSLRKHATGWVAKVLFGILVVSFAIWGIGDIFRAPHGGSTLAEVAGTHDHHAGGQRRVRRPPAADAAAVRQQSRPPRRREPRAAPAGRRRHRRPPAGRCPCPRPWAHRGGRLRGRDDPPRPAAPGHGRVRPLPLRPSAAQHGHERGRTTSRPCAATWSATIWSMP